ncbi:hypothetical protein AYI69_g8895 [Smittium culicis]|uniref:Uncharacterized protein n=1 Tax=Smittium culicis TaxID=133412 RepID=A0A1R1XGF5_9FUNG|nr:hypothetical protein AYI69_g8895 [Smittium culicis]
MAGPLAAWSGLWSADSDVPGSSTFFVILATMPDWLVAVTLVLVTCLGCSAVDTEICSLAGRPALFINRSSRPNWSDPQI